MNSRAFAAQRRGARGAAKLAEAAGQPLVRSRMEARPEETRRPPRQRARRHRRGRSPGDSSSNSTTTKPTAQSGRASATPARISGCRDAGRRGQALHGVSTTFPTLRRSPMIRCASAALSNGTASETTGWTVPSSMSSAQRRDPRLERAAVLPQRQHVQPDDRLGRLHLLDQVEAAQHRQRLGRDLQVVALLARVTTDEAPKATSRPPARSIVVGAPELARRRSRRGSGRTAAAPPTSRPRGSRRAWSTPLRADRVVLAGRRRAPDLGAEALGDLRRRDPDAAGRGLDQHLLARLQRAVAEQAGPRGRVVDGDRGALLEAEPLRAAGSRRRPGRRPRDA